MQSQCFFNINTVIVVHYTILVNNDLFTNNNYCCELLITDLMKMSPPFISKVANSQQLNVNSFITHMHPCECKNLAYEITYKMNSFIHQFLEPCQKVEHHLGKQPMMS